MSAPGTRVGLTVPLADEAMGSIGEIASLADQFGYDDIWSSETSRGDAFTPLVLASGSTLRLGTAIVPVFTRGPALLAQSFSSLMAVAPGRVIAGIGASSPAIVGAWNDIEFRRPVQRVRDTITFLRAALTGEKVTAEYQTFSVNGFRLAEAPGHAPPIHVAALREQMLRLAGSEADGVILNWLSADDVPMVARTVHDAGDNTEVVARIFVCVSDNADLVRAKARRHIAAYQSVPAYAEFQRWVGRGGQLTPMWEAWNAGDRRRALDVIPDEVVDDLIIHGSAAQCRKHIQRYVDAGVDTVVLDFMDWDSNTAHAMRALGDFSDRKDGQL